MEAIFCAGKAFFLLLAGRNGHQKTFGGTALVRKLGMHTLYLLIVYHLFYFICVHYADWTKWRSAFFSVQFSAAPAKRGTKQKTYGTAFDQNCFGLSMHNQKPRF